MTVIVTACSRRAYGPRGKNRDNVSANQRRVEGAFHNQCSRPSVQTVNFVYLGGLPPQAETLKSK